MSEGVVFDSQLQSTDAFGHPFEVARLLRSQGVVCRLVGVHNRLIDTEYRVEIEGSHEIWRDDAHRLWRVIQHQNGVADQGKTARETTI
jgi:hypothetical protein